MNRKIIYITTILVIAVIVTIAMAKCTGEKHEQDDIPVVEEKETLYGIEFEDLLIDEGVIGSGQTLSSIFSSYGLSPRVTDMTTRASEGIFNLKNMRAGNKYSVFMAPDSVKTVLHFVYEHSQTEYVVFTFRGDSVIVEKETKEIETYRKRGSSTIESSLWNSMVKEGMPPALAMNLSDIYAWTIDFFGIQEGDSYTLIYDQNFVDSIPVGTGRIWGAVFNHYGKEYYAIPFRQDSVISYWDENGNSLRKSFLKAPLQYSRISSKFSNSRLHPVLKIRRPHHGVDYAAPAGTEVYAVADGTVIYKGWDSKGGGNTLKIKHSSSLTTGYLHLRNFAKGISSGSRVRQGELIGYVGSTGTSTGPHLDYRVWKDGKPIDPLTITSEPGDPIKPENRDLFNYVRDITVAELKGKNIPDSLRISRLDSVRIKDLSFLTDSLLSDESPAR